MTPLEIAKSCLAMDGCDGVALDDRTLALAREVLRLTALHAECKDALDRENATADACAEEAGRFERRAREAEAALLEITEACMATEAWSPDTSEVRCIRLLARDREEAIAVLRDVYAPHEACPLCGHCKWLRGETGHDCRLAAVLRAAGEKEKE